MIRRSNGWVVCVLVCAGLCQADNSGSAATSAADSDPPPAAMADDPAGQALPPAPTAAMGRCKGVKSIKASCRNDGVVRGLIKFRKETWDGRVVVVGVGDERRYEVTVIGNKARLLTCCLHGHTTVTLLEPRSCLDPVEAVCPD